MITPGPELLHDSCTQALAAGSPVSPSVNDCEGQNTWRLGDVLRTALRASQALGVLSSAIIQVCKISLSKSVNSRKQPNKIACKDMSR